MIESGTQSRFSYDNGRRVAFDVRNHGQLRLAMLLDVAFEGLPPAGFVIDSGGFMVVSHQELAACFQAPDAEFFPIGTSASMEVAFQALRYLKGLSNEDWHQLGGPRFRESDLAIGKGWWRLTLLEEALPAVVVRITPA